MWSCTAPLQTPQANPPKAPRLLADWDGEPASVASSPYAGQVGTVQTSAAIAELPGYLELNQASPIVGVRPIYQPTQMSARPRPIQAVTANAAPNSSACRLCRCCGDFDSGGGFAEGQLLLARPTFADNTDGPAPHWPPWRQSSNRPKCTIGRDSNSPTEATFSRLAEFIQALRLVAQADAERQTTEHSQALAAAMRALEEAEDLVPRGSRLDADVQLTTLVSAHRTPVLKDMSLADLSPTVAAQRYYIYAEEQFAAAVGAEAGRVDRRVIRWAKSTVSSPTRSPRPSSNPKPKPRPIIKRHCWPMRATIWPPMTWPCCWRDGVRIAKLANC